MEDIEADCEGYHSYRQDQGRIHNPHSDSDMKKYSIEDQVDSGLGSLGYVSGELSNLSLPVIEEEQKKDRPDLSPNLGSLDITNSLSRLIIDNDNESACESKQSDRCDSGLEDIKQISVDSLEYMRGEHWISPHFSPEQVVDIFRGDEDGDNHLHLSIIHALPEVTMQIIGLAPDWEWLNQTNNLSQTPLHLAVITRQTTVVRRLMCAGAYVDVRDQMGNTPLHNACRLGFEDVVRTLLNPVKYEETYQNKYSIPFQRLPQDFESRNYEGLTCLHLAAIGGHINVMRLLLNAGANVNAVEGKGGRTVLHLAADWDNLSMLKYVLSRPDVDINARTYSGLTPILLAYGRKHDDIVEELYTRGALCESLSLSEDSDADISDEEMAEENVPNRSFGALPQTPYHQTVYR